MRLNETVGGTPNYAFRYLALKNGNAPKVAELQKTIHGDMGTEPQIQLNINQKELPDLRGFDNFFMSNVAKQKPRTSNLEMKDGQYVRMYDMVVGSKQFLGFRHEYQSGERPRGGLTQEKLGNVLSSLLAKEPMEISNDIESLQGQMSQADFDFVVTAYLSHGRIDFALELIKDADKYLIAIDKGGKTPEVLTGINLTRLFNPNINYGDNLFDIASIVLRGDPNNNELYNEMRENILKWPDDFKNVTTAQLSHLNTRLGPIRS
ncbi:MAG: hypothetical protein UR68_C0028G0041 [Candidatus Roizmanbacteria bacterium GW2011_GWA2_35_19]|uniref:Uncharacterized protein n=2 Tax=Candidatus Roizmaniibacteriota TaxID=1752723 RepID=A0A0G0BQD7_9BACT|nr:MAG: hypothetical protein UR63_C0010G0037 [Candidatus Roizmanbacteria bacterium GW2011_GWC2_35_12]KKP71724.1 MAG: hypothetical protein UR68_C0028G0041 [Candidatus Roizmanbacteria bacterium GW2011_GWA2_35_19]